MALAQVYQLHPRAPVRRVGRRNTSRPGGATRRRSLEAARSRRSADLAHWLHTVLAALRALLAKTRRQLARNLSSQDLASLAGVACLVVDCIAFGTVLVG
jgi:hypothetical protein